MDSGRRVVLVVDDDHTIRGVIRAVLEADHFQVVEAATGEVALDMLADWKDGDRPDIVVLDVMMPGIDGIEVCRRLDHDRMRVLMLTARDDPETQQASRDAGAADFLVKPFSAVELLDAIEALVRS